MLSDAPKLEKGYVLPGTSIILEKGWLEPYNRAVGQKHRGKSLQAPVSPVAVAGKGLIALTRPLNLPGGVVHTHALINSLSPVYTGEELLCQGRISRVISRGSVKLATVSFEIMKPDHQRVICGHMTYLLPGSNVKKSTFTGDKTYGNGSINACGRALPPVSRVVTHRDVESYALFSGDYNPLHLNRLFAGKTAFGNIIVHGMLVLGLVDEFLAGTFGKHYTDNGSLEARFKKPVLPGQKILLKGQANDNAPGPSDRDAACEVQVSSQNNELLLSVAAEFSTSSKGEAW